MKVVPTLSPPFRSKFSQLALSEKSNQEICRANWTLSFLIDSSKLGLGTRGVEVASSAPAEPIPIPLFVCPPDVASRLTRRERLGWTDSLVATEFAATTAGPVLPFETAVA